MMRNANVVIVAIACAVCGTLPAGSQRAGAYGVGSGSVQLTPRIECEYQYAHSGEGPDRSWVRSIVLWRGQPTWGKLKALDTAKVAAGERTWRAEYRMAEDSGWAMSGGVTNGTVHAVQYRKHGTQLHVLDRNFAIPERDSVLVVMMDRADGNGGPPYVAGATYMTLTVPEEFWPRMWTHGDTLFSIHPHQQGDLLAAALRKSPVVAAFMR